MKRQHPTDINLKKDEKGMFAETKRNPENPALYWCPKCEEYLPVDMFVKDTRRIVRTYCKKCSATILRSYLKDHPGKKKYYDKNWRGKHRDYCNTKAKIWAGNNKEKRKAILSASLKKHPKSDDQKLKDVVLYWARRNNIAISSEVFELRRQQIIMKRTLKQLKDWRKEHESDRDVISGEQREDETVNEVNRGCEETGHGCDCSVSAGM